MNANWYPVGAARNYRDNYSRLHVRGTPSNLCRVLKSGNCSLVGQGDCNYIILQKFCDNVVEAAVIRRDHTFLESRSHRK